MTHLRSLRLRLLGLWTLSLAACAAVALLLLQLYRESTVAQVGRAEAVVANACDLIRQRYDFYTAGWNGGAADLSDHALRRDLTAVVALALAHQDGVEGGIWQTSAGSLAYAYPTYAGSGPKTDLPLAERPQIAAANQEAAQEDTTVERQTASRSETILLDACPLPGPIQGLTAWTMTRVQAAPGYRPLQLGLGVLLGLMLLMSAWLGRTLFVWARKIRGIEASLAAAGPAGMPELGRTGERELDRIIEALNLAGRRLGEARRESEMLAGRVARAERLAALGRVAAGVAHEIRNPIAAARLQGENALAGDDARRRGAISEMLTQIDRLDALVGELLAMTQRVEPRPEHVSIATVLHDAAARSRALAEAGRVAVELGAADGAAWLDPAMVGRILDNLLSNAIRHTPPGGTVRLAAEAMADRLAITVADSGPGVPDSLSARLFEPFVTGRADGTGLGLAIARELADAHGGHLSLRDPGGEAAGHGAVFVLELPREPPCRPS